MRARIAGVLGSMLSGLAVLGSTGGPAGVPAWAADRLGSEIFQGACAICHAAGSARVRSGQKLLPATGAIAKAASPDHAIHIVLGGREPEPEQRGPMMPGFADVLDDQEIAAVLSWLREQAHAPAWPDLTRQVAAERASLGPPSQGARQ